MSVDKYPKVRDEFETLKKLQEGFSIARFGDGELKLATGKGYIRENPNRHMAHELNEILTKPHPRCLVGIWPLDPKSPKFRSMMRHRERFKTVLSPGVKYYSSLISRPDSAPWIRTREYALEFQKLWLGKNVAIVSEDRSGALRALGYEVGVTHQYTHIGCKRHGAYSEIDEIEECVVAVRPDIAILACGPTATCLANRLSKRGIQAIDFGSAGAFISKLLKDGDA